MIRVIKADERFRVDMGWLDARWHFSFGHYHDASNVRFGPLRVFNDDIIHGGGGFGEHGHDNMEIITIVVRGTLEHADSMGNRGTIGPGEVQVMSAGKGVRHSEFNASADEDVRLMQVWLLPREKNSEPGYEQKRFDVAGRENEWVPLVSSGSVHSGGEIDGTIGIDRDASFHRARLTEGGSLVWEPQAARRVYVFVVDGAVTLNGETLSGGDQARVEGEDRLEFTGGAGRAGGDGGVADVLLIDLP